MKAHRPGEIEGVPDAPWPTEPRFTQAEIAAAIGCSQTYVSQLERQALRKFREGVEREAAAAGVSAIERLNGE